MIRFRFGDIVLVRVPFTDQRGWKQRPAVVVSGAAYNRARPDLIVMALTSRIRSPLGFGEMSITDWAAAGLLRRSAIKPVVFTVAQRLVIRALGRLVNEDLGVLKKGARDLIG